MVIRASRAHYAAHLDPVAAALGDRLPTDVTLVASQRDYLRAYRDGVRRLVLAQHGAGQSYGGDRFAHAAEAYPGGRDSAGVGLFLVPNAHAAGRWSARYPGARVEIVGSPGAEALARWARLEPLSRSGRTVALAFHWDCPVCPETRSAFREVLPFLPALAGEFELLGHGHPRRTELARDYARVGIPYEPSLVEVARRADVVVADNTSAMYELAALGIPIVVVNASRYRRNVRHGLRFWDAIPGPMVDRPAELGDAIRRALERWPVDEAAREAALELVYQPRTGAAELAAAAILDWALTGPAAGS